MRTLPYDVLVARGLHALIEITLRDSVVRVTTDTIDRVVGGFTFSALAAVNITQIQWASDGTPANADVRLEANAGGPIKPGRATRGELDGLPISIKIFAVDNLGLGTFDLIPHATIGSAKEDTNGVITLAVMGPLSTALKPVTEVYTLTCKAKLGDDRCKFPLVVPDIGRNQGYIAAPLVAPPRFVYGRVKSGPDNADYNDVHYQCTSPGTTASVAPAFSTTPGDVIFDGGVIWVCVRSLVMAVLGEAVSFFDVQLTTVPAHFGTLEGYTPSPLGMLIPRSGLMIGIEIPIRAFDDGTNIVTLFEPFAPVNFPPGTEFDIYRGCDKLLATCVFDFNNKNNMRATPLSPSSDLVTGRS